MKPTRMRLLSVTRGTSASAGWTVIEPRRSSADYRIAELWEFRRLIGFFGRKLVDKMTMRSVLGYFWVPLRPLLNVATRALVFGGVLAAPSDGLPYFLFLLTGMAAWSLFERTMFWSVRSIELNAKIVSKLYFPRLLMPLAAFVPALLDFLVYVALVIGAVIGYGVLSGDFHVQLSWSLALLPVGLAILLAIAFGCGLFLSVVGAYARDFRFALGYLLGFLFFLTPIIYPLSAVPDGFRTLAMVNPISPPIELVRFALFGKGEVLGYPLALSASVALVACLAGFLFFVRWEAEAVDSL